MFWFGNFDFEFGYDAWIALIFFVLFNLLLFCLWLVLYENLVGCYDFIWYIHLWYFENCALDLALGTNSTGEMFDQVEEILIFDLKI